MRTLKHTLILMLALTLMLAGCTQRQQVSQPMPTQEVDVAQLADDMLAALTIDDDMLEIDRETIVNLYEYDSESIAAFKVYASATMSTANEVGVFKAASAEDVEFIEEMLSYRLQTQKFNYENYVPAEMTKIENAQVLKSGLYVALVVSDDPEPAKKIFNQAF
mgnify:CR=1 FL=1